MRSVGQGFPGARSRGALRPDRASLAGMGSRPPVSDAQTVTATEFPGSPAPPHGESEPQALANTELMVQAGAAVNLARATLAERGFEERYEEGALLGQGGMGEVRLYRDRRIGRDVAMKVLRPGAGSRSEARVRFEREARVQGQLEHPSVVPVYDLGIAPGGAAFFTMKRVRGLTMGAVLDELRAEDPAVVAAYSGRRLLTAFSQLCLAMAFAHSRGVLHRDLKPSNIMLGDFGEVHVLDWGLAKIVDGPEGPSSARAGQPVADEAAIGRPSEEDPTMPGMVMGTPGYMPPEQVSGGSLDARTDVFALGAILFEILTLQALVARGSVQEVLANTLKDFERRPSVAAPDREVPPELEAICVRATAPRPGDRYPSARALHDAVERYLDGDRDLENRRQLADEHARMAEEAVARAMRGGADSASERARAMREVSASMVLHPGHARAMGTLLRLLVDVPAAMPSEARAEFEATTRATTHLAHRVLPIAYGLWTACTAASAVLGIRSPGAYAIACALQAACGLLAWWMARRPEPGAARVLLYLLTAAALAATAGFMGPFVTVAPLAALLTTAFVTFGEPAHRRWLIVLGALALVVPLALELAGWLPPSYAIGSGAGILIEPRMTWFPPARTLAYWLMMNVTLVVAPPMLLVRARDVFVATEERVFLHAWHLRQLVAAEAHPRRVSDRPSRA